MAHMPCFNIVCLLSICFLKASVVRAQFDEPVAFMAELLIDRAFADGSAILFDGVKIDKPAGSYIPALGVYICPSDGWYMFMWTLHAPYGPAYAKLVLDDIDVKVGPLTQDSGPGRHSGSSSMSAIVRCNQGSAVWLKAIGWPDEQTSLMFQAKYSSFLGFKVYDLDLPPAEIATAFMVELRSNTSLSRGDVMKFDRVLLDIGGNYDETSGVYTCPMSGLYVFYHSLHTASSSGNTLFSIVNSDYYGPIVWNSVIMSTPSGTGSTQYVMQCNSGDNVNVVAERSAEYLAQQSGLLGYMLPDFESSVAFEANITNTVKLQNGQTLIFDNVVSNIGDSYFPVHGFFGCPDDSFYLFSWTIGAVMDTRDGELRLMMAGEEVKVGPKTSPAASRREAGTSTTQAIVQCQTGKSVYVQAVILDDPFELLEFGWSKFSGFKLPGYRYIA